MRRYSYISFVFLFYLSVLSILSACGGGGGDSAELSGFNSSSQPFTTTWNNPFNLTDNISPDGQNALYPDIALGGNGQSIVAWQQFDNLNLQIYKSERDGVTGAWTHPTNLNVNISPNGTNATEPQVAVDDNGYAIIIWTQWDGTNTRLYLSERDAMTGIWTHPANLTDSIDPLGGFVFVQPQIAMSSNGHAIIAWSQFNAGETKIYLSERDNVTKVWTHPADINDYISPDGQDAEYPKVAVAENGDAVLVWEQSDGSNTQIFMSQRDGTSGVWNHPADLTDNISPAGQDAVRPEVAMDDTGNATVAWSQDNGIAVQIFISDYHKTNDTWSHPTNISDSLTPGIDPRLVMGTDGSAALAWTMSNGSNSQVFFSERVDVDSNWVLPDNLNDNISPDGQNVQGSYLAMNNNDDIVICWNQSDGSNQQIFKSERDGVTKKWLTPSSLSDNISPNGQDAGTCNVTLNEGGKAFITWAQSDGFNFQIFISERL